MVGAGVLLECLDSPEVAAVLVVGRQTCAVRHPKLTEIVRADLADLRDVQGQLAGSDACFFCLGVSSVGMAEDAYRRVTYDLTLAVARQLLAVSPQAVFVYVSGEGTDETEQSRVMWARVKGRTENDLRALGFRAAYMFRPGFIQPLRGVRSKTEWYQAIYTLIGPAASLVRRLTPRFATTTVDIGRAMIRVAVDGYPRPILRTRDINQLAESGRGGR